MPQPSIPRRLLLSWHPTPGNENVNKWLGRFKVKLQVEREFRDIVDAREPGRDRAASRDTSWTDFVSVLTADYVIACEKQPEHELRWALSVLRGGVELKDMRFWAVRLDAAPPHNWAIQIGPGKDLDVPWDKSLRWHFLPEIDMANPRHLQIDAADLDTPIERDCISHLRNHVADVVACQVCHRDAVGVHEGPPARGLRRLLHRLFSRP